MKSLVTVYRLSWTETSFKDREKWFADRQEGLSYKSSLSGEAAAEEAFHLTNAPEELLTEEQKGILIEQNFKGPSLSVGDVVRVEALNKKEKLTDYFLCKSFGWEKFNGEKIPLIRHLLW